jgi:WD40 repeat protein
MWASGGGGIVCVLKNNETFKVPMEFPMIKGHTSSILDLDFYPFDDSFLATSSMDTSIKIW